MQCSISLWQSALVCLGLICAFPQEASAQAPAKPPELKVLDKYIGTWKFEITAKPALWTPKESRRSGTSTNEWALDGWFQHHKVKTDQGIEGIDIMTYDARKKTYRMWNFDSLGSSSELTGSWNEKTNTMTSKADFGDGITAVVEMHFIDNDNRESTMVAKDQAGKVYLDLRGKLTRQK